MSEQSWARSPRSGDPDLEARRIPARTEAPDRPPVPTRGGAPGQLPVADLLRLQRAAGNAAVVQLLGAGRAPTAPIPPAAQQQEERSDAAAEGPDISSLVGDVAVLEEGETPTKAQKDEKRAERDLPPQQEEPVDTSGGPFPIAAAGAAASFVDAGRRGSVPFGDAADEGFDPHDPDGDLRPRIFLAGGQKGKKAWAGGGGAGPKGNQPAGSLDVVEPTYESEWGGWGNASAWVADGTGTVTVKRDYVSSDPGDQGNGWYVTDKAAQALKAHEERHVASSRSIYANKIQPLLDRIFDSHTNGREIAWKSSDAVAIVRRNVSWADSIKAFTEDDIYSNAPNNAIDSADVGSARYPVPFNTPRKVNGKEFPFLLRMGDEPNPPE